MSTLERILFFGPILAMLAYIVWILATGGPRRLS